MSSNFDFKKIAVIPVYRDIVNAVTVLGKFRNGYVDGICLVVDCPEEDDLKEIKRAAAKIETPVFIIANKERKGIGYAIREGIEYGLANHYGVAVVMAGNNKDDPGEIPRLVAPIVKEGFDYVQGSRFLPGGRRVKNPSLRGVFSRIYPFIWTLCTNIRCTDVTNGFRAFKLNIFSKRHINIWQGWLDKYELEYYVHYKALTLGYKTKEVPVSKVYQYRNKGGYSHISPLRDWWGIIRPLVYLKLRIRV
jgi:dolichol-phosphate mannosyltransferase